MPSYLQKRCLPGSQADTRLQGIVLSGKPGLIESVLVVERRNLTLDRIASKLLESREDNNWGRIRFQLVQDAERLMFAVSRAYMAYRNFLDGISSLSELNSIEILHHNLWDLEISVLLATDYLETSGFQLEYRLITAFQDVVRCIASFYRTCLESMRLESALVKVMFSLALQSKFRVSSAIKDAMKRSANAFISSLDQFLDVFTKSCDEFKERPKEQQQSQYYTETVDTQQMLSGNIRREPEEMVEMYTPEALPNCYKMLQDHLQYLEKEVLQ
ncbi:hypothetical protein EDD86DRAFT_217035 [Gorgonomyces haynaldii]|nr:hypothetical protein EDD86DRAFT_217035 [Gorgonomyces haynaldii]